MGVGERIPDIFVDAVDDAGQDRSSALQHTSHPHPLFFRQDFAGIGRRYGRDCVTHSNAGFQEADIAIILEGVDVKEMVGKAQGREYACGKLALKGKVVDGEDDRDIGAVCPHVGGG